MESEDGLGVVVNTLFLLSMRRSYSGLYPSEFPMNIMPAVISVASMLMSYTSSTVTENKCAVLGIFLIQVVFWRRLS
jgi:hypothetical protein